jgi:phosphatidylserine decarboxylase
LEPVRPSYIEKHKDVLKDNERVNILGEWVNGFFTISFIGALNVGSIKLLFDDQLKTNKKAPAEPYFMDRNYQTLNEASGAFLSFPVRNKRPDALDLNITKEPFGIS